MAGPEGMERMEGVKGWHIDMIRTGFNSFRDRGPLASVMRRARASMRRGPLARLSVRRGSVVVYVVMRVAARGLLLLLQGNRVLVRKTTEALVWLTFTLS